MGVAVVTLHLPEDVERSIEAAVREGRFTSVEDAMTVAARLLLSRIAPAGPDSPELRGLAPDDPSAPRPPVWERVRRRMAEIPDAEWDKVPTDLADRHDHYLNGLRERPVE